VPGARRAAIAVCALALVLAGAVPVNPRGDLSRESLSGASLPSAGPEPTVAVDPSSWWLESGANTTFRATWVGTPAGCTLEPDWFRWSLGAGGTGGALGATNGSTVAFLAPEDGTGSTTLVVRAAATVACRGNLSAAFASADAVVTVAAPLAVRDLAFASDPVEPGSNATLEGTVVGGEPPYQVSIRWGDGTGSSASVSGPGPFSLGHEYRSGGTFEPQLLAADLAGRTEATGPAEPLNVSEGFAVALVPSTLVAEVGVPVSFALRALNVPANLSWSFTCPNATSVRVGTAAGISFGCTFGGVGTAPVRVAAVGGDPPYPVATATLRETVVPGPAVGFPGAPPLGEVGGTVLAPVALQGGVPPFTLSWSLLGTGQNGTESVPWDGADLLALSPDTAGTLVLSVLVLDALGTTSALEQEEVDVAPTLVAWASGAAGVGSGGVALNVSAGVVEGTPPFDWTVEAATPAANGSAVAGVLAGPGGFAWNATYLSEGNVAIRVVAVDAAGVSAVVNLSVPLARPLNVTVAADPTAAGEVTLEVTVSGGVAPFRYLWNDSSGNGGNGTWTEAGTRRIQEGPVDDGPCTFVIRVVDALGASASTEVDVSVPAPPSPATASWGLGGVLAAAAVLAAGGAAALLLRRRRPAIVPPPPDPVAVLREAIEPSDGVDRGLVELLAEERGVPLDVLRTTLERLKAEGTVRAGRGSDGEEVLAWSGPPSS